MRLTFLAFALACGVLSAADARPASQQDTPATNLPAHRIGVNDLLNIWVYDSPELTKLVRVGADGNIRMPLLPEPLHVAGLLPTELEQLISSELTKHQILVTPLVNASVAEYTSRSIAVSGAVKLPITFQTVGQTKLLDALNKAGGLTEDAGAYILLTRQNAEDQTVIDRISIRQLVEGIDPALNVALSGGEEIRVPPAGKVFVVGTVKKPGVFKVSDGKESTVMQMLALAEGLGAFSAKHAFLYRKADDGSRSEIQVELDKILRRKHADVAVLADDILYIPENRGRKLGLAALERILVFGSTAGATALVYGNR